MKPIDITKVTFREDTRTTLTDEGRRIVNEISEHPFMRDLGRLARDVCVDFGDESWRQRFGDTKLETHAGELIWAICTYEYAIHREQWVDRRYSIGTQMALQGDWIVRIDEWEEQGEMVRFSDETGQQHAWRKSAFLDEAAEIVLPPRPLSFFEPAPP